MADLATLIHQMRDQGYFELMASNPLSQFNAPRRRYYGAELLPERTLQENMFREDQVKFRTILANDGTRYSPTQKKDGDLIGYVDVDLGHSDIAREMTGRQYDAIIKLLGSNSNMEAVAQIANWSETVLNRALLEKSEKERWDAIVKAQVIRQGDNGYKETVNFSNPAGHRITASGAYTNDSIDPFDDIFTQADLLVQKGFGVSRIFTSRKVASILAGNAKVKARTGKVVVTTNGQLSATSGRAEISSINSALQADGLPAFELYDLQYRTQTGSGRFLPDDVIVMVATTARDENIDLGDGRILPVPDTLGYYGIGRAAGQPSPGRIINLEPKKDKPPRIEGEAYQCSFPVILEPEAICVISGIA